MIKIDENGNKVCILNKYELYFDENDSFTKCKVNNDIYTYVGTEQYEDKCIYAFKYGENKLYGIDNKGNWYFRNEDGGNWQQVGGGG